MKTSVILMGLITLMLGQAFASERTELNTRMEISYLPVCKDGQLSEVRVLAVSMIPEGVADEKDEGGFHINSLALNRNQVSVNAQTLEVKLDQVVLGTMKPESCVVNGEAATYRFDHTTNIEVSKNLKIEGVYQGTVCNRSLIYAAIKRRAYKLSFSDLNQTTTSEARQETGRYDNNSGFSCEPELTNKILYPSAK